MAVIDISTDLGKLRYRLGDFLDLPILPDSVYTQTLTDTKNADGTNNLRAATTLCGNYILASLSFSSHQKMAVIEIYGNQTFDQYKQYLMMVVTNPAFNSISPIPYSASTGEVVPVLRFQEDFAKNYASGTQSDAMHITALNGLNITAWY